MSLFAEDSIKFNGTYWYILDNITEVGPDAEFKLWMSIPTSDASQDLVIRNIYPKPAEISEDTEQGNRIGIWSLVPVEDQLTLLVKIEISGESHPVLTNINAADVKPYNKDSKLFKRFTASGQWIDTEGAALDRALSIVGNQTNPYLQAKAIFSWMNDNMNFIPANQAERSAKTTLMLRSGDCGQYSILFTAMCRSLEIPTRVVSGFWINGGHHRWSEFYIEGEGWIPVDVAAAQILMPDHVVFSEAEKNSFLEQKKITTSNPEWFFGNSPASLIRVTTGNNITVPSKTGKTARFVSLEPGGVNAFPEASEVYGLNNDVVQGSYFLTGKQSNNSDYAHNIAHQKLASKFFKHGLLDIVERGCLFAQEEDPDGVASWINLGKVALRKGKYPKAEAYFKRAMRGTVTDRKDKLESIIWVHNYLGNCYDLIGRRDMALEQYRKVLALDNNYRGAVAYAEKFSNRPFMKSDFE
jgi:transglutaminase-like putative cysteine protease